jgi:hypothetical protein
MAATVQRLHHTKNADPIAIFALRKGAHVGIGRAAETARHVRRNECILRRLHFVIFSTDHDRKGDAIPVRPFDRRPFHDRGVVVENPIMLVHRASPQKSAMRAATAS